MMNSVDNFERQYKSIAKNKKAYHDYLIMQKIEAGIVLQGTEVKSLRAGKCSMTDAYAHFPNKNNDEFFLMNLHITPYEHGNRENHESKRMRKLLVNSKEAAKLRTAIQEKGHTIIPLALFFSGAFVKVELGVARAKKKFDKRESNKKRDVDRELRRKYR